MWQRSALTFAMFITMGVIAPLAAQTNNTPSLWRTLAQLKSREFVDLTHAFHPGIPHWPGFEDEERTTVYHYDEMIGTRGSGFLAHRYCHAGQWGTHVDPPAHFVEGKRFQDDIPVTEMILPLVILDVSEKVAQNPDYQIQIEDVRVWEEKYGKVPEGAFAAMRTDWYKRWPNASQMRNEDQNGIAHYPGWSAEVLKYLYEERNITASGHETTDTDPGIATSRGDYSLETYILSQDKYQIELLANLDMVPEYGAIAIVTFPKPFKGSGFPARVFAIIP
ncbi:MAG: cyclase family protein [Symploca sp. SIO3C6]|nr:cyclase family protein [Symploca sp. SIO3C6]